MGGNLAWTLRTQAGTEYRMDRWTNGIPALIHADGFLSGQPAAIEQALEEWLVMKDDWQRNRANETFEHQMTAVYAPYPFGLKPSEYGLIVTDFATKTILSLQGYTNLSRLNATRLCHGPMADEFAPARSDQIRHAAAAGRIKTYEIMIKGADASQEMKASGAEIEASPYGDDVFFARFPGSTRYDILSELCDRIRDNVPAHPRSDDIADWRRNLASRPDGDSEKVRIASALDMMESSHKAEQNPIMSASAIIDLSPFTLEEFTEDAEGYAALRERIGDLGFALTAEEEEAWQTRIDTMSAAEIEASTKK